MEMAVDPEERSNLNQEIKEAAAKKMEEGADLGDEWVSTTH
jgi:hypothetical protein